jgi:hypothetical protein
MPPNLPQRDENGKPLFVFETVPMAPAPFGETAIFVLGSDAQCRVYRERHGYCGPWGDPADAVWLARHLARTASREERRRLRSLAIVDELEVLEAMPTADLIAMGGRSKVYGAPWRALSHPVVLRGSPQRRGIVQTNYAGTQIDHPQIKAWLEERKMAARPMILIVKKVRYAGNRWVDMNIRLVDFETAAHAMEFKFRWL